MTVLRFLGFPAAVKTYYIAGYNSDNPAEGVPDDMYARAV